MSKTKWWVVFAAVYLTFAIFVCGCTPKTNGNITGGTTTSNYDDTKASELSTVGTTAINTENNDITNDSESVSTDITQGYMREYYTLEDFQFLVIGKSKLSDVYTAFSIVELAATSYGGLAEFPMENGGHINLKFYHMDGLGLDMILGAIEEIAP